MEKQRIIIRPPAAFSLNIKELWQYRELLYFFAWRDIKVKYKQTYLGIAWAVLQPLLLMFLFTFVFSKNIHISSGSVPYQPFVLSGLIVWNFFQTTVSGASESILSQSEMIRKIYFPRLLIPASKLVAALLDCLITLCVFLLYCLITHQALTVWGLLSIPAALLVTAMSGVGIGIFLSAFVIKYRDAKYLIPFLVQFLFFASAIVYSTQSIHQTWLRFLLALNPVNGALELFRLSLQKSPVQMTEGISLLTCFLVTAAGLYYFRKTETTFADLA